MGYQLYITEVFEQRYDMEEDNRHGVVDSPIVCYQSPVMMVQLVTAGVIHSTFCTLSYKYKYKHTYKYSTIVCNVCNCPSVWGALLLCVVVNHTEEL